MDEIIYGIFKVQYDFALEVWFSIDKIQGSPNILSLFPNNFNNTAA